jgi:hypothetical protein
MHPQEIMSTHAQRKTERFTHPVHEHAYNVEAHVGQQAGFEVYGFICPKCHVAVAVNGITNPDGTPTDFLHTCGAYIRFIIPEPKPAA